MSAPQDPPAPDSDEPRVGDLLSGRASEEDLDPETMAQLAAWFGAPVPGGPAAGGEPDAPPRSPAQTRREQVHRAIEGIDEAFLARMEHKWADAAVLCALGRPAPTSIGRRPPSRFDLAAWRLPPGPEEARTYERPEHIAEALEEPTPQAILRDLHRPEQQWPRRLVPQELGLGLDIFGATNLARARTLMAAPCVVRMDDEPVSAQFISDDMAALRARIRDEPWEDSYVPPEDRAGRVSYVPTAEDLKWFGMVGFDPDL